MQSRIGEQAAIEPVPSRRLDRVSVLLALATLALVAWTAWMQFGASSRLEPPAVGSTLPPLTLIDLETAEPVILLGLKGKVVWVVFWSAGSPSGDATLSRLESVWKRLKADRRFSLVAAAVNFKEPERVRAALTKNHATLSAYLAGQDTSQRFGAGSADPPLHFLCDPQGRIAVIARGRGQETINRLEAQVQGWLEQLDPMADTRFAMIQPKEVVASEFTR